MNATEWTSLRARLNHDVLQNQVLTELAVIRTAPQSGEAYRLAGWLSQVNSYRQLLDQASTVLDASKLVDAKMFSSWTAEMKSSLSGIFRDIFKIAHAIDERVRSLLLQLNVCVDEVSSFLRTDKSRRSAESVVIIESHLSALSRGISELPRPVWAHLYPDQPGGHE